MTDETRASSNGSGAGTTNGRGAGTTRPLDLAVIIEDAAGALGVELDEEAPPGGGLPGHAPPGRELDEDAPPDAAPLSLVPVGPVELTETEHSVLSAMARGLTNTEIAAELGVTDHTVKTHVSHVTDKLGAANRTDAVRMYLRAQSR